MTAGSDDMAGRRFFTFVLGSAAVAAGVSILKKNGGVHVSFDIEPTKLGPSLAEWKTEHGEPGKKTGSEEQGTVDIVD